MHKTRSVYNTFYKKLSLLKASSLVNDVVKTGVDTEQEMPIISVIIGPDNPEEFTKEIYQHDLTIYTDISVRQSNTSLDDQTINIRELIERHVLNIGNMGLDYVFKIDFVGEDAPDYNGEGVDYSSTTRLEWLIEYHSPHNNPSI